MKARRHHRPARAAVEELEPRILYSADFAASVAGEDEWPAQAEVRILEAAPVPAQTFTQASGEREIAFVDWRVPDYQKLIDDLRAQQAAGRDLEIVMVDAARNGIAQISQALAQRHDVRAIHLVAHGSDGVLELGSSALDAGALRAHAGRIAAWGEALARDADILIYGCSVAESPAGKALVDALATLTRADVAASTDATGAAERGGDWLLEYDTGAIETASLLAPAAQFAWDGLLATLSPTTTADVLDGNTGSIAALLASPGADGKISLREAIIAANNTPGADRIDLPAGTYVIAKAGSGEDHAASGDLDVRDGLTLVGAGSGSTVIDAAGSDRVFDVLGGTVTISRLTAQNGRAADGGGISVTSGASLTLRDAVLTGNYATSTGGAIRVSNTLILDRVTIEGNSADVGAGIYVRNGAHATVSNSTISGNAAASDSGAISARGDIAITNSTIAYNSAATAGGIDKQGSASVTLKNTILAYNSGGNGSGALTSLGNNIDSGSSAGLSGQGDRSNIDPLLGPLQNNGGAIPTHALLAGSPAINAGTNLGAPGDDTRGYLRGDGRADIGAFEANAASADKIYWADQTNNSIQRANLDGSSVENVVTSANSPTGLLVDAAGGKIYWSEYYAGNIRRANLDGSGIETLYGGLQNPAGMALDGANNKLYWTENPLAFGSNRIRSASMTGGGAIQTLVSTGTNDPVDMALDLGAGKIYWTDGNNGEIRRANMDGSGTAVLLSGLTKPQGLRLDLSARMMYWASDGFGTNKIQRANLDGAIVIQDLVTSGLNSPIGIELNAAAGKIYWSDWGTDRIQSANVDGTNVQNLITSGLSLPIGIAIGPGVDANDAPLLTGANNLIAINEDAASNAGTLVSALIAGGVSDPDSGALSGIAVTAVDNTHGTWQYSTNGGGVWSSFGSPTEASARLLAADGSTAVRFVPNAHWNGTAAIGLRAWDRTGGAAGGTADTSINGGASAFSTFIASAGITVTAVNDAPAGSDNTITTAEDTAYIFSAADFGFGDPHDSPADSLYAVRISTLPASGTLTNNAVAVSAGQTIPLADINAGRLRFTPAVNASGTSYAAFTFRVQDNGGSANGGVSLDPTPNTLTINVTASNDAPVNSVPGAQATAYNTPLILSAAKGNRISISDADVGSADVEVTLTAADGTLTLSRLAGLVITSGTNGSAAMTITGSLTSINAALDGLAFAPSSNFSGTAGITIHTSDLDAGGALTDMDSVVVTVTAPTPLTIVDDSFVCAESSGLNAPSVLANDVDPASGAMSVAAVNGSAAAVGNTIALPSGASLSINPDGTFTYNPNSIFDALAQGASATDSFTYDVSSTSGGSGSGTVIVTITGMNDAPSLVGANDLNSIDEDSASDDGTLVSALIAGHISDPDSGALSGIAVTAVDNTHGTWQYSTNGGGVWSSFGSPTEASARLLAADGSTAVRFVPNAHWNGTAAIALRAWDRTGGAAGGTADTSINGGASAFSTFIASAGITVTAVNDAPTGSDNTITTAEDTAYIFSAADFGFGDPHDASPNSFRAVRISALPAAGALTNRGVPISTGQMVMLSDIDAGGLKFIPAADANGTGYASFAFQVQDDGGSTDGGIDLDPAPKLLTIDVSGVDDAPIVTTSAASAGFSEGNNVAAIPVAIDPGLMLAEVDSPTLAAASASIGAGFESAEDVLAFVNTDASAFGNIAAVYDAGSGVLGLNSAGATATLAQWQNALRAVTYGNLSDTPNSATRVIAFVANDGSNASAVATRAVTVTPVDDAPNIGAIADQTLEEDTTSAALWLTIGDADSDIDALTLTATSSDQSLLPDGNLTLGGSGANRTLVLAPAANLHGAPVTITLTVSDGVSSASTTFDVVVTPVNDAPRASAVNANGIEREAVALELRAADIDGSVASFALSALPANGTLYLDSALSIAAVTDTDYAASADALALYFAPAPDWSGIAQFRFTATDDRGARSAPANANVIIAAIDAPAPGLPLSTPPSVSNPAPQASATSDEAAESEDLTPQRRPGSVAPLANDQNVATALQPTSQVSAAQGVDPVLAAPADAGTRQEKLLEIEIAGPALDPSDSGVQARSQHALAVPAAAAQRAARALLLPQAAAPALVPMTIGQDIQAVLGPGFEPRPGAPAAAAVEATTFRQGLDRVRESLNAQTSLDHRLAGISVGAGGGLSVGYVLWLLRGGALLASLMSSLPAWLVVDPLPILAQNRKRADDDDKDTNDESLEDLVAAEKSR